MNASLLLAEYITVHPNGFFSLLNGGINALASQPANDKGQQPHFNGHLLVRIDAQGAAAGNHALKLRLSDSSGALLIPELNVQFQTPGQPTAPVNLVFALPIPLKRGSYLFQCAIDEQLLAAWPLAIVDAQKPAGSAPPSNSFGQSGAPSNAPGGNPWGGAGFGNAPWGRGPQA